MTVFSRQHGRQFETGDTATSNDNVMPGILSVHSESFTGESSSMFRLHALSCQTVSRGPECEGGYQEP